MVEKFRVPAEAAEGVPLAVVPHQSQGASRFAIGRVNPQGTFNLWLCEACGYSELWAENLSGLRHDPISGVRLVDSSTDAGGPFR